jgi:hypothetical protein
MTREETNNNIECSSINSLGCQFATKSKEAQSKTDRARTNDGQTQDENQPSIYSYIHPSFAR